MKFEDAIIDSSGLNLDVLLREWTWIEQKPKSILCISKLGDLFFQDEKGEIFWLECHGDVPKKVAENEAHFFEKLADSEDFNFWFGTFLIEKMNEKGMVLLAGQCFHFKRPPIFSDGDYVVENMSVSDIQSHFDFYGIFTFQVKDLPDGTTVEIVVSD